MRRAMSTRRVQRRAASAVVLGIGVLVGTSWSLPAAAEPEHSSWVTTAPRVGTPTTAQTDNQAGASSRAHRGVSHQPVSGLRGDPARSSKQSNVATSPDNITEFHIPTANSAPLGITTGPDGNLWFTEYQASQLGRITPSGSIVEGPLGSSSRYPLGIATGPDGNIWFTEAADRLGRITSCCTQEIGITAGSNPLAITPGPNGNVWFTEYLGNRVGEMSTSGALTEFDIPTQNSQPYGITLGSDGNLWFAEQNGNKIGRITPAGSITEFPVPSGGSSPTGVTTGPDGNVWFTEMNGNKIGRITPAGSITEFPVPTAASSPLSITTGKDGSLWFTEFTGNNIGRITPAGAITEYQVPTSDSGPGGITLGPDGRIWFTEANGGNIARFNLLNKQLSAPKDVKVSLGNGTAHVSWKPSKNTGSSPIESYIVAATPLANDRVPAPNAPTVTQVAPSSSTSLDLQSLVADCHQTYRFTVTAFSEAGVSLAGAPSGGPYRPSGFIQTNTNGDPSLVVVILDGKDAAIGAETSISGSPKSFDPLEPTTKGPASYCPEAPWDGKSQQEPTPLVPGLYPFFYKWSFTGALPPTDFTTGTFTHDYMLDHLAAVGGVMIPYSYAGITLGAKGGKPSLTFPGYTVDGNSAPQTEAGYLASEVASIHSQWKTSKIVLIGHSHGGLLAYLYWGDSGYGPGVAAEGVTHIFSLDAPINGVESLGSVCGEVCSATWNFYGELWFNSTQTDLNAINNDGDQSFTPIGTEGDTQAFGPVEDPTVDGIYSQELFDCTGAIGGADCNPAVPPDVVSTNCAVTSQTTQQVQDQSHSAVKICPDYIRYISQVVTGSSQ